MILTGCLRHTCLHAPFSQADVLGHLAVRGAVPIGVRKRVRNASSCAMRGHECCGGTRHMPHRKHIFIRQALRRMRSSAMRGAFGEKPPRCEVFALPAGACVRGARARVRRTGQKSVNPKISSAAEVWLAEFRRACNGRATWRRLQPMFRDTLPAEDCPLSPACEGHL